MIFRVLVSSAEEMSTKYSNISVNGLLVEHLVDILYALNWPTPMRPYRKDLTDSNVSSGDSNASLQCL